MSVIDIYKATKRIREALEAGKEIKEAGIWLSVKGWINPNKRPQIAVYLNAIPPHPEGGDKSDVFIKWAESKNMEPHIIDLTTFDIPLSSQKLLSPEDMRVLVKAFSREINKETRKYRVSLALRTPNAMTYLIGQSVKRNIQLLQYQSQFARQAYGMENADPYVEFPLPILTKKERLRRLFDVIAAVWTFISAGLAIIFIVIPILVSIVIAIL